MLATTQSIPPAAIGHLIIKPVARRSQSAWRWDAHTVRKGEAEETEKPPVPTALLFKRVKAKPNAARVTFQTIHHSVGDAGVIEIDRQPIITLISF